MKKTGWIIPVFMLCYHITSGQSLPVNRQLFFLDERVIEATLTTDIRKLRNNKSKPAWQTADIIMKFSDTAVIEERIRVRLRGVFRKTNCDIASLMLGFKNTSSPKLSSLKNLKLVGGCKSSSRDEILLLKEYMVYKVYNFLSVMSFRVRLLHITYKDSQQKTKSYSQYAFLIEDIKDLADRNNCKEIISRTVKTESTDRQHINFLSIFQYMIGNTDWAVPSSHNIKLIVPKNDTTAYPYPVPYDFDYAGFVNAAYAIPSEEIGTKLVTERAYRGYEREMIELEPNLDIFKQKKDQIMFFIKNFELLKPNDKREITEYIEEFYEIISNKRLCKSIFINNARKN